MKWPAFSRPAAVEASAGAWAGMVAGPVHGGRT